MADRVSSDKKYCKDCGAEIHVKAEICPSCGIRQMELVIPPKPTEDASGWWYLLPICLGIIGGFLGWLGLRGRDPKKATNCIIVGVVVTVINYLIILPAIIAL